MDIVATLNEALSGHYRLEREVGSGGMATVYHAEDLKHHRQVAIKVLRSDLSATVGSDRFLREIEIAAQLQHPNILPLLDSGEANGLVFYVMPFVEGGSLARRLSREGELPIAEALRLLVGIVDALAHAHAHGVVHRDVKPDNVMLSGRHPFVTDFGVARALSEASEYSDLTTLGVALGTPAYMSPEQAAADPHVDHRADLYAVGVVAYEMFTGQPPFTGNTPQQILAAQVTQAPTPLSTFRPGVSAELEGIVMRCLEKRAANRWQSADELLTKLEGLVTPSGGTAPTSAELPAVVTPKRISRWVAGGAAVALALALAFGWIPLPGGGPPPLPVLGQSSRVTTGDGLATHAAVSPDGTLVAYAAGEARRMRVFIQPVGGGRTITLSEESEAFEYQPRWSPDGTQILYLTPEGVRIASSLGGASRLIAGRGDAGAALSAAWAPDGQRLAVARGREIVIVSLAGGEETALGTAGDGLHSCAWSPDGRWIACADGNPGAVVPGTNFGNLAPSVIVLIDAETGVAGPLTRGDVMSESPVWSPDGRRLFFVSNMDGQRDIYVLDLDRDGNARGAPRRLTTGIGAISLAFSADGRRLIYVEYSGRANIWTLPIPTTRVSASTATPLTSGDQVVESILLSYDGEWVVYDSNVSGNADVYRLPVGGGTPERLTDHPADDFAGALSPDASTLAWHSWRTGSRDIFVRPLGGQPLQVTFTDSQESYPTWSADGRSLFFFDQAAGGGGQLGLHRVDFDGETWSEPVQLREAAAAALPMGTDSIVYARRGRIEMAPALGGQPREVYRPRDGSDDPFAERVVVPSDDGRTLYFKAHASDGRGGLWSIPVAGGPPDLLVDFDDPDRPSIRADFGAGAGRFFFTLEERRSTVWVVELTPR